MERKASKPTASLNSKSARGRALAEVALEFISILVYVWYLERNTPNWVRFSFFWAFCVGFPLICISRGQKEFPEFSLDWGEFESCLMGVLWFTGAATIFLVGIAVFFDGFHYDGQWPGRLSEYCFWAFLQQVGLQCFLTRRFQKVFKDPWKIAVASATVFSALHFPNPVLLSLTWLGGYFWTRSFLQAPSLYALAVSHGWLAVVALYCVPVSWMHQLRVGPGYWLFNP